MAKIRNKNIYPIDSNISDKDILIGSDGDKKFKTKNFLIGDLKTHILSDYNEDSQVDGISNGDGTFTWVKYATDILGANMTDEPTAETLYIGLAYNKLTASESENPLDYTWSLINGEISWTDENGVIHYTWLKYADTPISGMSDEPLGKQYIGFAFDKSTPTESENYSDYKWSKVTSNSGTDGIPVPGTTLFTWVKYGDDIYGSGLSDSPNGKLYIGLAYNKDTYVESTNAGDYTWGLIDGVNIDAEGKYTWIKYADTPLTGISDSPIGKSYIGFSFGNDSAVESEVYSDYNWSLIKSNANGDSTGGVATPTDNLYTWLKYADDAIGTNMADSPDGKLYIGLAINKNTATESDDPTDYIWTLISGVVSYIGADGKTYYIWVKYASDANGTGLSDDPTGLTYIGLAYRKETPIESENPADYEWALILGEIKEQPKWLYVWVKFANDALGNGMSDFPDGKLYMGLAYDKSTPIESIDPTDYVWNLITGEQGYVGADGKTYYTWVKYAKTPNSAILFDIPDGSDWIGMAFNKDTPIESNDYLDYTWSPLSHTEITDSTAFNQNNLIRVINIPTSYFDDKAVTEQTISDWVNANGISVSETENIIFSIGDTVDPTYEPPSLDPNISLPLILTGTTADTASFTWANSDSALIRYELFYNTLVDDLGDLNVTSKTLTGLSPIAYSCYVIGYDTYGTPKQSNTVTFSLYVASTPNIYVGTNTGDVTDTSIRVNWDIDASFGATRYELYRNGVKVYDGALLTFNSTGLTQNTSYAFYVIAYNGATASLPSETINVPTVTTVAETRTLTAPVIAFVSNTDTSIKFSIAVPNDEIGRITAIRIEYKPTTSTTWNEAPAIAYSNVANLTKLFDNTNYQIRVRSTDGAIISPYSNILTQSTLSIEKAKISLRLSRELTALEISQGYTLPLTIWDGKPNTKVDVHFALSVDYFNNTVVGDILFKNSLIVVNGGMPITETVTLDANGRFEDLFELSSQSNGSVFTLTVVITKSVNGTDALQKSDSREYILSY